MKLKRELMDYKVSVKEPGNKTFEAFYRIDAQALDSDLALAFCIGKLIDGSDVDALLIERIYR